MFARILGIINSFLLCYMHFYNYIILKIITILNINLVKGWEILKENFSNILQIFSSIWTIFIIFECFCYQMLLLYYDLIFEILIKLKDFLNEIINFFEQHFKNILNLNENLNNNLNEKDPFSELKNPIAPSNWSNQLIAQKKKNFYTFNNVQISFLKKK